MALTMSELQDDSVSRAAGIVLVVLMFTAAILPYLYGVAEKPASQGPDDLEWARGEQRGYQRFYHLTKGGARFNPAQKALIVRGVDDEAGLILAAGSIATRLLSFFSDASFTVTKLVASFCVLAIIIRMVPIPYPPIELVRSQIMHILYNNTFVFSVIYTVMLFYVLPIVVRYIQKPIWKRVANRRVYMRYHVIFLTRF
jgi:hypothetical protein